MSYSSSSMEWMAINFHRALTLKDLYIVQLTKIWNLKKIWDLNASSRKYDYDREALRGGKPIYDVSWYERMKFR